MKATGGSDSDPDEKEAADQELLRDCQQHIARFLLH